MAEAGFRYPPMENYMPVSETTSSLVGIPGPLDVSAAQLRGYGPEIGSSPGATDPETALQEYLAGLTANQQATFTSAEHGDGREVTITTPDGVVASAAADGCIADARKAVYGSVEDFLRLQYQPQAVYSLVSGVENTPEVQAAAQEYSQLMAQSGYDLANPAEARVLARQNFGSRGMNDPASDEERAMAVADAKAQKASQVYEVLAEAAVAKAADWLVRNEALLVELAEIQAASLERAGAIIRS
jgi:hypothetical protein